MGDVSPAQPVDGRSDAWCPVGKGGSVPHEGLRSCGPASHVWSTGNTPQTLPLPVSAWPPAWASGCLFAVPARHPQGPDPSPTEGFPGAWAQLAGPRPRALNAAPSVQPTRPLHPSQTRSPTQMLWCSPEPPHRAREGHTPPRHPRSLQPSARAARPTLSPGKHPPPGSSCKLAPTLVRNTLPVSHLQGAAPVGLDASEKSSLPASRTDTYFKWKHYITGRLS